jgi:hypothetical protein
MELVFNSNNIDPIILKRLSHGRFATLRLKENGSNMELIVNAKGNTYGIAIPTGTTTAGGGADNLGNHTATQDLSLANNKITNLATPTSTTDAATKAYVDSNSGGITKYYEASDDATWATAKTNAASNNGIIVVTGTVNITASETLSTSIAAVTAVGGTFNISSGQTLTLPKEVPLRGDLRPIKTGSGSIKINAPQVIYPQWFGVVTMGTGATTAQANTNRLAIMEAIDAGNDDGCHVHFCAGTWKISTEEITIQRNNIKLTGEGWGTKIIQETDNKHTIEARHADPTVITNRLTNITFEDMQVEGSGFKAGTAKPNANPSWTDACAFEIVNCTHVRFHRVKAGNCAYDAFGVPKNSTDILFEDCVAFNCYDDGFNPGGFPGDGTQPNLAGIIDDIKIINCRAEYCRGAGFHMSGGARDIHEDNVTAFRCYYGFDWTNVENMELSNWQAIECGDPLGTDPNISQYPGGVVYNQVTAGAPLVARENNYKNVVITDGNIQRAVNRLHATAVVHAINLDNKVGDGLIIKNINVDLNGINAIYNNAFGGFNFGTNINTSWNNITVEDITLVAPSTFGTATNITPAGLNVNISKFNITGFTETRISTTAILKKFNISGWGTRGADVQVNGINVEGFNFNAGSPTTAQEGIRALAANSTIKNCYFRNCFLNAFSTATGDYNIIGNEFETTGTVAYTPISVPSFTDGSFICKDNLMYGSGTNRFAQGIYSRGANGKFINNIIQFCVTGYTFDNHPHPNTFISGGSISDFTTLAINSVAPAAAESKFTVTGVQITNSAATTNAIYINANQTNEKIILTSNILDVNCTGVCMLTRSNNSMAISNRVTNAGAGNEIDIANGGGGTGNVVDHNITVA